MLNVLTGLTSAHAHPADSEIDTALAAVGASVTGVCFYPAYLLFTYVRAAEVLRRGEHTVTALSPSHSSIVAFSPDF